MRLLFFWFTCIGISMSKFSNFDSLFIDISRKIILITRFTLIFIFSKKMIFFIFVLRFIFVFVKWNINCFLMFNTKRTGRIINLINLCGRVFSFIMILFFFFIKFIDDLINSFRFETSFPIIFKWSSASLFNSKWFKWRLIFIFYLIFS
jgi:hypothetical protein